MTQMRWLVARMDGTAASGFAPGSIQPQKGVPIIRNFDPREPPIGVADITVEGENVYADVQRLQPIGVSGLYPALGGTSDSSDYGGKGHVFTSFSVLCVSVCDSANEDPRIPAISVRDGDPTPRPKAQQEAVTRTTDAKSCADYPGHIWKKDGKNPTQVGTPCVCGEEVWEADDEEWPPDGYTNEEAVALLFATFVNSHRETP